MDLHHASIALIGRLDRVPRRRLTAALHGADASLTRRPSKRSTLIVVTHGAVALLPSGRLEALIAQADERSVPVVSEHRLLRSLGLMPALPAEPRAHTLHELAAWAGISAATARLLALFDVVEEDAGLYSFRDLKAARDFARRLDHRRDLAAALCAALAARRRHAFRRHLAEVPLGGEVAEQQIALDLGDPAASFETLWAMAMEAQAELDHAAAEEALRRCAAMRPRDAPCLAHLAEVVEQLGRPDEARALLRRALAIQPDFAGAWLHLSRLEEGGAAIRCLERAVAADPDCVEAVHALAQIQTKSGAYDAALPLWERYLSRVPHASSPADQAALAHAKRALMLCRMARLQQKTKTRTPNR